jgi:hypothetical protein
MGRSASAPPQTSLPVRQDSDRYRSASRRVYVFLAARFTRVYRIRAQSHAGGDTAQALSARRCRSPTRRLRSARRADPSYPDFRRRGAPLKSDDRHRQRVRAVARDHRRHCKAGRSGADRRRPSEGHEKSVLDGAIETIRREKPNLILELEERYHLGITKQAADLLDDLGYRGVFLWNGKMLPQRLFKPEVHQKLDDGQPRAPYAWNFVSTTDDALLARISGWTRGRRSRPSPTSALLYS